MALRPTALPFGSLISGNGVKSGRANGKTEMAMKSPLAGPIGMWLTTNSLEPLSPTATPCGSRPAGTVLTTFANLILTAETVLLKRLATYATPLDTAMAVGVWPTATVLTFPLAVSMKPNWPFASPPAARSVHTLGFTDESAAAQFGFLMDAFTYGAPPHAGLAFGFDRLCSIFAGADSIRDFIAFPKNNAGRDVMSQSPAPIAPEQLEELQIKLDVK